MTSRVRALVLVARGLTTRRARTGRGYDAPRRGGSAGASGPGRARAAARRERADPRRTGSRAARGCSWPRGDRRARGRARWSPTPSASGSPTCRTRASLAAAPVEIVIYLLFAAGIGVCARGLWLRRRAPARPSASCSSSASSIGWTLTQGDGDLTHRIGYVVLARVGRGHRPGAQPGLGRGARLADAAAARTPVRRRRSCPRAASRATWPAAATRASARCRPRSAICALRHAVEEAQHEDPALARRAARRAAA